MIVIKSDIEYEQFLSDIDRQQVYVDYVISAYGKHVVNNDIICIFIKVIKSDKTYCINLGHQDIFKYTANKSDIIKDIIKLVKNIFVVDKKKFIHLFGCKEVDDILIYKFQSSVIEGDDDFSTNYHDFLKLKIGEPDEFNYIIPLTKHIESFEDKYEYYKSDIETFKFSDSYKMMNDTITETLCKLESNGIKVDLQEYHKHFTDKPITGDMVYSEYNLFTATGRPSNHFGGINYAALNKENGCRSSFVSRYGDNGVLITMDYSAYHPRIIANLVRYPIDVNVNIYEFLGKQYYNLDVIDDELMKKAKQMTFLNLYGGVRDEYLDIPYFQKVNEYVKHRWEFFNDNGYVETPIFKRRITKNHIVDASPSKLFNYILQASETEFSVQHIERVNAYLESKQTKVVLYTYDSITLDSHTDDGLETLLNIKNIMVDNQFPVKCYAGKNYQNMTPINI